MFFIVRNRTVTTSPGSGSIGVLYCAVSSLYNARLLNTGRILLIYSCTRSTLFKSSMFSLPFSQSLIFYFILLQKKIQPGPWIFRQMSRLYFLFSGFSCQRRKMFFHDLSKPLDHRSERYDHNDSHRSDLSAERKSDHSRHKIKRDSHRFERYFRQMPGDNDRNRIVRCRAHIHIHI